MTDFRDLIDLGDLDPRDEARLRRAHDLLVQAGPPPDLPPSLVRPPAGPEGGEIVKFPLVPRRRRAAFAVLAAAVAIAVFGGGYVFGHSKARPATFHAERAVPMHGTGSGVARAVVAVAAADNVGNWPLQMRVTGLPQQSSGAYYELWLTDRHGAPIASCGTFRVHSKTTTIRFNVPYHLKQYGGWIVTSVAPGSPEPGRTVMTT